MSMPNTTYYPQNHPCAHGVYQHQPCAACGRGYPSPYPMTFAVRIEITEADIDRVAERVVDRLGSIVGRHLIDLTARVDQLEADAHAEEVVRLERSEPGDDT